jgi:nucleoside recognition membrane protein YjiH
MLIYLWNATQWNMTMIICICNSCSGHELNIIIIIIKRWYDSFIYRVLLKQQLSSYLILIIASAWLTACFRNLCSFQLKPMFRIFKVYASFIGGLCFFYQGPKLICQIKTYASFIQSLYSKLIVLILVAFASQCFYLLDLSKGLCSY